MAVPRQPQAAQQSIGVQLQHEFYQPFGAVVKVDRLVATVPNGIGEGLISGAHEFESAPDHGVENQVISVPVSGE